MSRGLPDLRPYANGDCFHKALDVAATMHKTNPDPDHSTVYVCHGLPIGAGPTNLGKRYWHAWVEIVGGVQPWVFDFSMGLQTSMRRAEYYRRGKIVYDDVFRYDIETVARGFAVMYSLGMTPTSGPWEIGWQEMSEV